MSMNLYKNSISVVEMHISKERNMFVAEQFIRSISEKYVKQIFYTNCGALYP